MNDKKTWWNKEDDIKFFRTVSLGYDHIYQDIADECKVDITAYIENRMSNILYDSGLTQKEFARIYWNEWDDMMELKDELIKKYGEI